MGFKPPIQIHGILSRLFEIFPFKNLDWIQFFLPPVWFSHIFSRYFFVFAIAPWPGAQIMGINSILVCYQVLKNDHHDLWSGKLGDLIVGTNDKHESRTRKQSEVADEHVIKTCWIQQSRAKVNKGCHQYCLSFFFPRKALLESIRYETPCNWWI